MSEVAVQLIREWLFVALIAASAVGVAAGVLLSAIPRLGSAARGVSIGSGAAAQVLILVWLAFRLVAYSIYTLLSLDLSFALQSILLAIAGLLLLAAGKGVVLLNIRSWGDVAATRAKDERVFVPSVLTIRAIGATALVSSLLASIVVTLWS